MWEGNWQSQVKMSNTVPPVPDLNFVPDRTLTCWFSFLDDDEDNDSDSFFRRSDVHIISMLNQKPTIQILGEEPSQRQSSKSNLPETWLWKYAKAICIEEPATWMRRRRWTNIYFWIRNTFSKALEQPMKWLLDQIDSLMGSIFVEIPRGGRNRRLNGGWLVVLQCFGALVP